MPKNADQHVPFLSSLIASQLVGYGLAGLARDYLVYPTWAVYPFLMPQIQLFDAMHRGKGMFLQKKRRVFFWSVLVGIFVWEWFPEYIAPYVSPRALASCQLPYKHTYLQDAHRYLHCLPGGAEERVGHSVRGAPLVKLIITEQSRYRSVFGGAAGNEGLGMFALCFDWNYVGAGGGAIGSLFTPLATQLSLYSGVVVCMCVSPLFSYPDFQSG